MALLSLTPQQQTAANSASRGAVVSALADLKRYFPYNRWLGSANRYRRNTVQVLRTDVSSNLIRSKHLAEYIAASTILHCADGWGFLSRAVSSHMAGDGKQALHLAYYSELRAAMSLLAAEGFGVFDNRHFVVTSAGACLTLPGDTGGTHRITWKLLDYWSGTSAAASLLGRVLSPGGKQLSEWIGAFPGGSSASIAGSDFLRSWGVDIQRLADDRDARNEASYRPDRLATQSHLDAWNSAQFLTDLWETFEPANHSRVAHVDRFLLRNILEATYQSVYGRRKDRRGFKVDLARMIDGFGLSDQLSADWISFLSRESNAQDPAIMIAARKDLKRDTPEHHTHVMARAALLLRVASGACHELLRDSLVSREEVRFWWNSLGLDRGLWSNTGEPLDFTDLWADVETALEDLRSWIETSAADGTRRDLLAQRAVEIAALSSCERVALWASIP